MADRPSQTSKNCDAKDFQVRYESARPRGPCQHLLACGSSRIEGGTGFATARHGHWRSEILSTGSFCSGVFLRSSKGLDFQKHLVDRVKLQEQKNEMQNCRIARVDAQRTGI